ncbi:MAG: PEP-CTERM sorting domain-containing protein, partial [Rhodospirillales bacterium]|nr:PEP-CTERM sorting domain-containing protein [Rhodospirillales bacterium]
VQLQTTVSGLTAAAYDVYVVYITNSSNSWSVQAGLDGVSSVALETVDGSEPSIASGSSGQTILDYVGTTNTATSFSVTIGPGAIAAGNRTYWVGVAYKAIPEPASMALVGMGGLLLIVRRRRQVL